MEIKDNTELFKKRKKEAEEVAEVCRVCGSKKVHSRTYEKPTMECIQFLRVENTKLENALIAMRKLS